MAYVRTNTARTRYTGYFRDADGVRRPAGTFDSPEEALQRAKEAEKHGTKDFPPTMTVEAWADKFLGETPTLSDRTKLHYRSLYLRFINPVFGQRLVGDITRREVRSFLDGLFRSGTGAATVNHVKCALACIYKPLVVDDMIPMSPTDKIPSYRNPRKEFEVVELDEFKKIRTELPTEGAVLFADFLISTGLRFGEATEVRVKDLFTRRGVTTLTVSRVVSDIGAKHNGGSRFKVIGGTKGKWNARKVRTVPLPKSFAERIFEWVEKNGLDEGDLIFPVRLVEPDGRAPRGGNTTGHLPRDSWRRIWRAAVKKSKIGWYPRTHDLRHACASHMLEAGASIQEVKDLLGHGQITTTERYLHSLKKVRETTPFDAIWEAS